MGIMLDERIQVFTTYRCTSEQLFYLLSDKCVASPLSSTLVVKRGTKLFKINLILVLVGSFV